MLITFCLALLTAKFFHYRVGVLFRSWTVYPLFAAEAVHIFFQIHTYFGDYQFIPFASALKTTYMLLFLIPMFIYRLYWPGIAGSALVLAGTGLNRFAIWQNSGKMPVFPSLSYWTGYVRPVGFQGISSLHVLGDGTTKFWFLTDFIDVGYSILSVGDILIRGYAFLIFFFTIRELNRRMAAAPQTPMPAESK